jgi:endonuclease III
MRQFHTLEIIQLVRLTMSSSSNTISNFFRPKKRPPPADNDNDEDIIDANKKAKKRLNLNGSNQQVNDGDHIVDLTELDPSPLSSVNSHNNNDDSGFLRVESSLELQQSASPPPPARRNPFEMFAHSEVSSHNSTTSCTAAAAAAATSSRPSSFMRQIPVASRGGNSSWKHCSNNRKQNLTTKKHHGKGNNASNDNSKTFVRMNELSREEQERITHKWLSLADLPPAAAAAAAAATADLLNDTNVSSSNLIEIRRFQVLVAARLHARCQEASVRKAMESLRSYFYFRRTTASRSNTRSSSCDVVVDDDDDDSTSGDVNSSTITINNIASADPDVLAQECLMNLQFYNVKAQNLVKAAKEILTQHGGTVPEDEHSLLRITGVGKVFADLLAFVNTREKHVNFVSAHCTTI